MRINLLLQANAPEGYVATVLGWPGMVITGKTKDETLARARQAVRNQLSKSEFVSFDLEPDPFDPWMKFAGMWENDPTFDEFLAEIAAYRRELDEQEQK